MRRKSHVRIGGGRELQGSFLPLRRSKSSLAQHPPASHDPARHLRLTSHASACAIVLLALGLIVYAPHCPSWYTYRQVPPKDSPDLLAAVNRTSTLVRSSLASMMLGVR